MNRHFKIALAGNPNCGKTSIFNALTGAHQHVGNYAGVTVEGKIGHFTLNGDDIELIDIPGVYSLSSSSPEEDVVFHELTKPGIDLIINVVDSTIPQRSLYLTTQLAELHIPMLMVLNMSDDARKKGLKFDTRKLGTYFGSPVVQTIGSKANGIRSLLNQLSKTLTELEDHGVPMLSYGEDIDDAIAAVSQKIDELNLIQYSHIPSRFFAIKLLEHDTAVMRIKDFESVYPEVETQIKHLWDKHAIEADTFMADRRYAMLAGACRNSISLSHEKRREISDKIDTVLLNKYLGLPLFLLIIYVTFWFTFTCAEPFMGFIETFFVWLNDAIKETWDPNFWPLIRDVVTNGIISGVGGVLVFLPNILFLFFAIAILEDSGYMARAAFVMDGVMRTFGLQGRSFVPLILGFGCTVPAIMATRTIESERDRRITIMVLPLMSCGARLPIYALFIPVFFAKHQSLVMCLMYFIGIVIALVAASFMKKTLFKGDGEVYLMELPPYRMPMLKSLLYHMWDHGKMYVHKAGTIILAASVVLYICNTFPQKKELSQNYEQQIVQLRTSHGLTATEVAELEKTKIFDATTLKSVWETGVLSKDAQETLEEKHLTEEQADLIRKVKKLHNEIVQVSNTRQAELMEYTVSGKVGHFLEPVFRPMGFDWKLITASIGALATKEVFVSQLGIVYAQGETMQESTPLREVLKQNYTPLQALCIMLFCLLSIPCFATLAIIRRELNSWGWTIVEAGSFFLLAYILTTITYQIGHFLHIGVKMLV